MSDKNFKVKNGIDSTGPVTITTPNTSTTGLIINVPGGGKSISFLREGVERASIDDWGSFTTNGISVVQQWWVRNPAIDTQSFFWVGSGSRSSVGIAGTNSGTNPVVYISQTGTATNDLTQWLKPDNTILAKVDYLGNITANDLTLAGNLTVNGTTTNLNSTNLVIEDKNIIIADVATPTDTTADGAGITIKGATDKTFTWVNSTKSFTSSEPLIINNSSTTTVPFTINGYASQTSNLFEIKDSNSNVLFKIIPQPGNFAFNNRIVIRPGGDAGPAHIGTDSYTFRIITGGGSSIQLGTPGGGTSLEVVASDSFNRYKIIGTGTGIAPTFTTDGSDTDVNMYITAKGAGKIGINKTSPTGYVHVLSPSSSTVGMIIQAAASQSAKLQVWQDNSGATLTSINHNGVFETNIGIYAPSLQPINGGGSYLSFTQGSPVTANTLSASVVPFAVKGAASQTANLQEWQNSAGTVLARVDASGILTANQITSNGLFTANGDIKIVSGFNIFESSNTGTYLNFASNGITVTHRGITSNTNFIVKGMSSQTSNLQEWQNSAGTILAKVDSNGSITAATNLIVGNASMFYTGGNYYNATLSIATQGAGYSGIVIRGQASQTANLQEWQNSAGTVAAYIAANGNASIGGVALTSSSIYIPSGNLLATTYVTGPNNTGGAYATFDNSSVKIEQRNAASVNLIVKGAASQTANLQEWQDSSGTVLAGINSSGNLNLATGKQVIFGSYVGTKINLGYGAAYQIGVDDYTLALEVDNTSNIGKVAVRSSSATYGTSYVNPIELYANGQIKQNLTVASNVGLIIKGAASQTADLQQWQDTSGTVLGSVVQTDSNNMVLRLPQIQGKSGGYPWISFGSSITNTANQATDKPLVVKGASSQSANLTEWQNSSGTPLSYVDANGRFISSTAVNVGSFPAGYTYLGVGIPNGAVPGIIVRASASGQTANLQEWQNSGGTVIASIDQYGNAGFGGGGATSSQGLYVKTNSNPAVTGIVVQGASSQTANLQEWKNGAGTVLTRIASDGSIYRGATTIDSYGAIYTTETMAIGASSGQRFATGGMTIINREQASAIIFGVKGIASQTGDLTQWRNSSDTVLAKIDKDGGYSSLYGASLATANVSPVAGISLFVGGQSGAVANTILKNSSGATYDFIRFQDYSGTTLAKLDYLGNFSAVSKSFDIEHPTKENMRLRYASLEGPENGVYIRGTVESNIIELPEYWTGLVHEDSITVSLTAVGSAQNIYVEKIEDNKVYIGGELTKAFFTIYGERKDIDKLVVEY